jgi:hypothetical protein
MDFNYQQVQRLGFDEYCTNLAVNLIEDGHLVDGYKFENDVYSVSVSKVEKNYSVNVRAYVPSIGWQSTEIVL